MPRLLGVLAAIVVVAAVTIRWCRPWRAMV
jgi:hypothetical protein